MARGSVSRRAAIAWGLAPMLARAQAPGFPDRPLRLIVPFPPGGPVDAAARIVAQAMAPLLGQQLVVENRSGAGGSVGIDAVAKSSPDGFTLGLGSTGAVAVNVSLIPNLSYDPRRDLAPVGLVSAVPSLLVVRRRPEIGDSCCSMGHWTDSRRGRRCVLWVDDR
jgi:tripartite-type tricarboxylate transporter receptor subunit TctC